MRDDYIFRLGRNRVLTLYEKAVGLKNGEMPGPKMAIIYPVYGCNLNCRGCEYHEDNLNNTMLDEERFARLLAELKDAGVKSVEFCGGGEPTLYPGLKRIITRGRGLGLYFGLLTNGTNIRGGLAEVISRELSYVRVSFSATTPETYEQIHRPRAGDSFDSVTDNIRNLIAIRDEMKSPLLVSIKMLISRSNMREIPAMFELAEELRVDSLQFKALRLGEDEITPEQAGLVTGRIEELKSSHGKLSVVGGVVKTNAKYRCWLNPVQTVIDAGGDVFLCCYYRFRKESHRIGNIFDGDFRAIWGSPEHRKAVSETKVEECNLLDCRFVEYMELLDRLMSDNGHQIDFF